MLSHTKCQDLQCIQWKHIQYRSVMSTWKTDRNCIKKYLSRDRNKYEKKTKKKNIRSLWQHKRLHPESPPESQLLAKFSNHKSYEK